jgi:aldehyde:ferredoxin oxidoreductase
MRTFCRRCQGADLSPENVLTLMTGVTLGAGLRSEPHQCKCKSPIGGGIGDSRVAGFPAELQVLMEL